jgi:hypothetical protein
MTICHRVALLDDPKFWTTQILDFEDFVVARLSTLLAISICGVLFAPTSGFAQSDQDNRCFPWQEFRDGACAAKPAQDAPPASQSRQLTTTPRDAPPAATPAVAPPPIPPPLPAPPPVAAVPINVLCDGGTVNGSTCNCPAGYALLPATSGNGGTCVRSNAENCRGGVQTVAGICLCDGRVTMSGETYALEFLGGKCVPKRCPDRSYLKDGKCVASNDVRFSFTCRTGYVPDEGTPSTAATGLHCVPDPTFCPAELKRKSGACGSSAAIAIDCFEGRCICGPNADFVNYLCQCTAPYRNVNGTCVSGAVADTADKHTGRPELASEPAAHKKACGRGMVRTRSGACVAARPRLPDAGDLGVYYRRAQRYRDYPGQQPQDIR